jgi:hypothetical protein
MRKPEQHTPVPPQLIRNPTRAVERLNEVHGRIYNSPRSELEQFGILQAITKTHLFVCHATEDPNQKYTWAPSKLAAFEVDFEDYNQFRDKAMAGAVGPRLFRALGDVVPYDHPACTIIRQKCTELGLNPRRDFEVIEIRPTLSRDKRAVTITNAIVDLLPLLDADGRSRVAKVIAEIEEAKR